MLCVMPVVDCVAAEGSCCWHYKYYGCCCCFVSLVFLSAMLPALACIAQGQVSLLHVLLFSLCALFAQALERSDAHHWQGTEPG